MRNLAPVTTHSISLSEMLLADQYIEERTSSVTDVTYFVTEDRIHHDSRNNARLHILRHRDYFTAA